MKLVTCLVVGLALLGPTACSAALPGAAAPTPASATPSPPPPVRPAFGAYLDPSVSMPNLSAMAEQTGLKHVVLSFVLAKGSACEPAWGGTEPLDSLKADIDLFRAAGGSVTIATGGAEGAYVENTCGSAADLAAAYTKVLDATGTNLLDIDIEQDVQIDKVIDALGQVHRARGTDITLTLPVDLDGLGPGQLNLVKRAAQTNLPITVNIMDMDFDASGNWGTALVRAAKAMLAQLRKVYPKATDAEQYRRLSITIMIGRNDNGVITQPADAQTVLNFAKANGVDGSGSGRSGGTSAPARDRWRRNRTAAGSCNRTTSSPDCSRSTQVRRPPDGRSWAKDDPQVLGHVRRSQHRVDLGAVERQRRDREAELVLVQGRRPAPAAAARRVEHRSALQLGASVAGHARSAGDGPRVRRPDRGLRVPSRDVLEQPPRARDDRHDHHDPDQPLHQPDHDPDGQPGQHEYPDDLRNAQDDPRHGGPLSKPAAPRHRRYPVAGPSTMRRADPQ